MEQEHLLYSLIYRHTRIQRRIGVLEYVLHLRTLKAKFFSFKMGNVLAIQNDLTAGRFIKPDYAPGQSALSAAGLSYKAEVFAFIDIQIYVIDCFYELVFLSRYEVRDAVLHGEPHGKILDLNQLFTVFIVEVHPHIIHCFPPPLQEHL